MTSDLSSIKELMDLQELNRRNPFFPCTSYLFLDHSIMGYLLNNKFLRSFMRLSIRFPMHSIYSHRYLDDKGNFWDSSQKYHQYSSYHSNRKDKEDYLSKYRHKWCSIPHFYHICNDLDYLSKFRPHNNVS